MAPSRSICRALRVRLSAFLEPFPGALANIRGSCYGLVDDFTCTFIDQYRSLVDFRDGRTGFSALLLHLHVAIHDNDSGIPFDRRPNPFHAVRDTLRHIDLIESPVRLLGDGMAASIQQGQADKQPGQHARLEPDSCQEKASKRLSLRFRPVITRQQHRGIVRPMSAIPPDPRRSIRSRDFARFGNATETGSSPAFQVDVEMAAVPEIRRRPHPPLHGVPGRSGIVERELEFLRANAQHEALADRRGRRLAGGAHAAELPPTQPTPSRSRYSLRVQSKKFMVPMKSATKRDPGAS